MKMLIVDDDRVTRELLKEIFEREGYELELVPSGEAALKAIAERAYPLVLSDVRMLEIDGFQVLSRIQRLSKPSVVILMTGFGTMEGAIKAIQEGAFDYVSKPFKLEEVKGVVRRAKRHWETVHGSASRGRVAPPARTEPISSRALIGKSPRIVEVYKTLARAALSPSNVLIVGESGTGKELVARAIHEYGSRRDRKFIAVNCGALADTLLESELFGHMKGAFTGAIANKLGLFAEADGGTLFLDEIGDVSAALQVKLLRALQEGEFKPVGSNETRSVDVRVIAATHRDLAAAVAAGTFREDLFYRLKVITIELPALRQRPEDVPELVGHFLARFSEKTGKQVSHVSKDAMDRLVAYAWPGNVRELEHAVEHAVAMTRTTVLETEDFPTGIPSATNGGGNSETTAPASGSLEDVEKSHILRVLQETQFNKSRAAAVLGIDRKTLHRKAQRYGITLKDRD